ncbi:unnamed protein product [Prorocentrum cordatum]|uniref:RRM domain-containing protein n=1 Tax=Prorocentrum cordatum TaxID=2364126 RepID=A0ABN9PNG2_9DINO|nr:unnamed protein product [Polarella glacialis]
MASSAGCGPSQWVNSVISNATCNDSGFSGPPGTCRGDSQGVRMAASSTDTFRPGVHSQPPMQAPPAQEMDAEFWETDDEFDHPRSIATAASSRGGCAPDSAQGAARPASDPRPPPLPGGAPLLHGAARPVHGGRAAPPRPPGVRLRPAARPQQQQTGPPGDWSSQWRAPAHAGGEAAPEARGLGRGRSARPPAWGRPAGACGGERASAGTPEERRVEQRRQLPERRAGVVGLELQRSGAPSPAEGAALAAPDSGHARATTTLVIRNIPMDTTQRDLLDLIDRTGFANRYDFVYMPTDFDAGTARGHAFVNFATPSVARDFFTMWNGSKLVIAGATSPMLEISASALQGYSENADRWKASRLRRTRNPEHRPFIAERPAAE